MKKFNFPHPVMLLLGFVLFAGILTYIIPSGSYDRVEDPATGRDVVVAGSYKTVEHDPLTPWEILVEVPRGLIFGADLITLILIAGAAFYIVDKSGALRGLVTFLVNRFSKSEEWILVIVGIGFAIAGVVENMQEEIIAIIPVIIILTNRIGFNTYVAVAITFGCACVGAAFSPINPFQVVVAQKIADVPVFSESLYRIVFLIVALSAWIYMVIRHAKKERIERIVEDVESKLSPRHVFILISVALSFVLMVYGVVELGWDYDSMTAVFLLIAITAGIFGKMGFTDWAKYFVEGCKEMIFASIIVGLARSVYLTLEDGMIIDTIVNGLFTPLQHLPPTVSALGMMGSHFFLHFPLPSVSGQAVVTIPLLTPLSDLIGLSRQVMILAYQFGAGSADLLVPTNGALMAIIATAKIPYSKWVTYVKWKLLVIFLIGMVGVIIGGMIGI